MGSSEKSPLPFLPSIPELDPFLVILNFAIFIMRPYSTSEKRIVVVLLLGQRKNEESLEYTVQDAILECVYVWVGMGRIDDR